jgi:hypothetical protein
MECRTDRRPTGLAVTGLIRAACRPQDRRAIDVRRRMLRHWSGSSRPQLQSASVAHVQWHDEVACM